MYRWRTLEIPRFYGLDLKTNVIDVKETFSLDCKNVFQNSRGVVSKRSGHQIMFASDESSTSRIDEIGACTISGTKYYFKFVDGLFKYSTSLTGSITTITPSPLIAADTAGIWWAVIDDKLFFVDGTNDLRYFDGSTIALSFIYPRPTEAPTTASVGTGYDYTYTVDDGLGESPACNNTLVNKPAGSGIVVDLTNNPGSSNILEGYKIRVYSKATTVAAAFILVATWDVSAADVIAGFSTIPTNLLTEVAGVQLYTELGLAVNKTAPTALTGITIHYGRLVGWKDSTVHNSKSSNPHSWPDDSAAHEAFVYSYADGDGEVISRCISFQESLYVMKDTKITIFVGVGPDDTGNNAYALRRLETNGIGCVAGKSVQIIGDDEKSNNYLIFLASDGFYATGGATPYRIGERIETQIQPFSKTTKRLAVSLFDKKVGAYHCYVGGDITNNGWILDVRKDEGSLVGWFKFSDFNPACVFWDEDRYIYGNKNGFCASQRVANNFLDFSDIKTEYIDFSSINIATNEITVSNSYQTNDTLVIRTTGTVPAGLVVNTTYFAIRISATVIKLAATSGGSAIDITSQGAGTHSIIASQAISAYYTTNWIKFNSAAHVKKLAKVLVIFDATAESVSMTMTSAYDWENSFTDTHSIEINSSNLWGDGLWGSFIWGAGAIGRPKNIAIARRKVRSIRYKFENNTINKDFNLKGIEQQFAYIRNRGEFA